MTNASSCCMKAEYSVDPTETTSIGSFSSSSILFSSILSTKDIIYKSLYRQIIRRLTGYIIIYFYLHGVTTDERFIATPRKYAGNCPNSMLWRGVTGERITYMKLLLILYNYTTPCRVYVTRKMGNFHSPFIRNLFCTHFQ